MTRTTSVTSWCGTALTDSMVKQLIIITCCLIQLTLQSSSATVLVNKGDNVTLVCGSRNHTHAQQTRPQPEWDNGVTGQQQSQWSEEGGPTSPLQFAGGSTAGSSMNTAGEAGTTTDGSTEEDANAPHRHDQRNNSSDVALATSVINTSNAASVEAIEWILPGRANTSGSLIRDKSGALYIVNVAQEAEGQYICNRTDYQHTVQVKIRRIPNRVLNLTVSSHSIYATVSWSVYGKQQIDGFVCKFRKDTSLLQQVSPRDLVFINSSHHLGPQSRTCDLYDLQPNHTYYVKVAAYNSAGEGGYVSAIVKTTPGTFFNHSPHRALAIAVTISILLTIVAVFIIGVLYVRLYRRCTDHQPASPLEDLSPEDESLELVPHITLNPAFNIEMLEHISPDYNENSEHAFLMEQEGATAQ